MRRVALGCCVAIGALAFSLCGLTIVLALFNSRVGANTDSAASAMRATPPPPLAKAVTLKVVTFNVQNTWVVGRRRPERMRAIGRVLTDLDPDIVGFQEVFVEKSRKILIEALQTSRLRYHEYFRSGTFGSGLMISSAFPIKEAFFHRFQDAGAWYQIREGDWWAGKGVALARVELPDAGFLDFYTTHAQASYRNPAYVAVRKRQMTELARFIAETRTGTALALLTGDMNCRRGAPDYETAVTAAGLMRVMNLDTAIDHVFAVEDPRYAVEVLETVSIEGSSRGETRLSDHSGYMTTLRIRPLSTEQG